MDYPRQFGLGTCRGNPQQVQQPLPPKRLHLGWNVTQLGLMQKLSEGVGHDVTLRRRAIILCWQRLFGIPSPKPTKSDVF